MRDALLKFGNITIATANTYASAADILDMDAVTKSGNVADLNVVVRFATAPASGNVKIKITTGATSALGTTLQEATIAADGVKTAFAMPMPKEHLRYVGCEATAGATGTCSAALELGY